MIIKTFSLVFVLCLYQIELSKLIRESSEIIIER